MELFKQATGINAVPIHYKGGAASSRALLSGEVKVGFSLVPQVLPQVRAGKLKAYIVSGRERFPDDFAAHLRGDDCGRRHLGASMAISGWPPPWFTPGPGVSPKTTTEGTP